MRRVRDVQDLIVNPYRRGKVREPGIAANGPRSVGVIVAHLEPAVRVIGQRNANIPHAAVMTSATNGIAGQRPLRVHVIVQIVDASASAQMKIARNAHATTKNGHRHRKNDIVLRHRNAQQPMPEPKCLRMHTDPLPEMTSTIDMVKPIEHMKKNI